MVRCNGRSRLKHSARLSEFNDAGVRDIDVDQIPRGLVQNLVAELAQRDGRDHCGPERTALTIPALSKLRPFAAADNSAARSAACSRREPRSLASKKAPHGAQPQEPAERRGRLCFGCRKLVAIALGQDLVALYRTQPPDALGLAENEEPRRELHETDAARDEKTRTPPEGTLDRGEKDRNQLFRFRGPDQAAPF